jgi:hypothetical protein
MAWNNIAERATYLVGDVIRLSPQGMAKKRQWLSNSPIPCQKIKIQGYSVFIARRAPIML